jgi:hydrogenase maturation protease
MTEIKRKVVLGIGNILNRDEGLGVHALMKMDPQIKSRSGFEFVDGGVLGLNLLMIVEECSHLLILDAVNAGKQPGTVIELEKEQIPLYTGVNLSLHQTTFQEVLGLAKIRGNLPKFLHLVGIQPRDMSIGLGMSPEIEQALPIMLRRAASILENWHEIDSRKIGD